MKPQPIAAAVVTALGAAALDTKRTGKYLGCSDSWLEQRRPADLKRIERGEPMIGPRWVVLPYGVRYLRSDLDAWLASSAVPLAVLQSARRTKAAP